MSSDKSLKSMSGSAFSDPLLFLRCLAVEVNNSASVSTNKFSDDHKKPLNNGAVTRPNNESLLTNSAILSKPSGFSGYDGLPSIAATELLSSSNCRIDSLRPALSLQIKTRSFSFATNTRKREIGSASRRWTAMSGTGKNCAASVDSFSRMRRA